MKKYNVLTNCPVCSEELTVKKLKCNHCQTEIEGSFRLSKFNYLDQEKLYFIELFVKNRGNIKAIEKEMDLSYPTVKKMLDDVIVSLGYKLEEEVEKDPPEISVKTIVLDELKKGMITVEEAIKKIKGKGEK